MSVSVTAQESGSAVRVFVDGNEIVSDKIPVIRNSITLAPIRPVAEACGINVGWEDETSEVILSHDFLTVTLSVGQSEMKVYNSAIDELDTVSLDQAPIIIDSSTYIALRPALEALGARVDWDGENRHINVTSVANIQSNVQTDSPTNTQNDTQNDTQNNTQNNTQSDTQATETTVQEQPDTVYTVDGISYTGFREMANHKITQSAPHGLYGRIIASEPITLVRCRIVGTKMDYTLFFRESDNLTNYNVYTYFDKLICFSDAGLGNQTFEVYAAVNGGESKLVLSYDYTVVSKDVQTSPEDAESIETEKEATESGEEDQPITEENSDSVSNTEDQPVTPSMSEEKSDLVVNIGYYGFVKMTDDIIVQSAPHGLYGNLVSNYPLTEVRCRIVGTEMDYTVNIPEEDEILQYNIFSQFDRLICFSDAGLGGQRFELYAGVANLPSQLVFSYGYEVVEKDVAENKTETSTENAGNITDIADVCLPLEGTIKVTSPYGFRAYNKWEFHKGVDIISDSLNILAVADGKVVDCATGRNSGVGNYVAIQHEGGWVSLYYHLASYDVEIGDTVKKGQKFAIMGNTGGNYGVHLHFMTCDNWYGTIWATQNNHHTAPHEYVPQLLTDAIFYNPSFEKVNTDKMILCTFRFPTVLEMGQAFSISSSNAFVASENPLESLTLTITDTDGNVLLSETVTDPEYTVSGIYTYTPITAAFDMMCEFDKLPLGKMKVTVIAVSSKGRERIVYEKDFEVVSADSSTEAGKAEEDAKLTPEEATKTDAFEGNVSENQDEAASSENTENTEIDAESDV